jgi:hypothetical protein
LAACPVAPSACLLVTQARCPAPLQVQQFEDSFTRQVKALRVQQEAAQQQLLSDMAARRPQRPKPSGEYLQQRRIQEAAAACSTLCFTGAGAMHSQQCPAHAAAVLPAARRV